MSAGDDLAAAERELQRARNSMQSSTFHGRERTERAEQEVKRLRRMDAALRDWQAPYRSRDASGSPETAGAVGWAWIEQQAAEAAGICERERLSIESSPFTHGNGVHALYLDQQPIAVATIFRDPMNFAVLVRWAA